MLLTVAAIIAAGIVVSLLVVARRRRRQTPSAVLEAAARYEAEGRVEAACYHYGIAAWRGAREVGASRVRELWRAHGPFSFAEASKDLRHSYCSRSASCGEAFDEVTLREIRRIVSERAE